jgi:hypothetical protein
MHYVQYVGPYDAIDLSPVLGKEVVFNAPTNPLVPQDQRGNVIQVTNEHFDEVMTYPGHKFVEVEESAAKELIARQTTAQKRREEFAAFQVAHEAQFAPAVSAPSIQSQIASFPTAVEVAPAAPRPASEIKAEVRAETTALKDAAAAASTPAATK